MWKIFLESNFLHPSKIISSNPLKILPNDPLKSKFSLNPIRASIKSNNFEYFSHLMAILKQFNKNHPQITHFDKNSKLLKIVQSVG